MTEKTDFWQLSLPVRGWFYLVSPSESTPKPGNVIDFVNLSIPLFVVAVIIEFAISPWTKKRIRMNDAITSITAGSFGQVISLLQLQAYEKAMYPGRHCPKVSMSNISEFQK